MCRQWWSCNLAIFVSSKKRWVRIKPPQNASVFFPILSSGFPQTFQSFQSILTKSPFPKTRYIHQQNIHSFSRAPQRPPRQTSFLHHIVRCPSTSGSSNALGASDCESPKVPPKKDVDMVVNFTGPIFQKKTSKLAIFPQFSGWTYSNFETTS